ncbi:hypothetical protein DFP72DRAFT_911905 [Ephemerocybe angulata]|uniref:Fungal-type protein kinase domain-containing protein n=1 Tax=Ephemerocybe angulata TaxID=980116 RepID=A0A8H6LZH5_9AGAR|nr:hypothetical protein DFP72DRAFT_911905 [Tulosesus angulatus]
MRITPVFQDGGKNTNLVADHRSATELCWQLRTTMADILNHQLRTSTFMGFIHDPYVRLICGDRTGLIVTKAINLRVDPRPFFHFLAAFEAASSVEQGVDLSVSFASAADTKIAHEVLATWKPSHKCSVFSVDVPPKDEGGQSRRVLVWGAFLVAGSLTGRGARWYRHGISQTRRSVSSRIIGGWMSRIWRKRPG